MSLTPKQIKETTTYQKTSQEIKELWQQIVSKMNLINDILDDSYCFYIDNDGDLMFRKNPEEDK